MFSRTFAAIVLAFTFVIALGGFYTMLGPGSPDQNFVWALLLIVPLWTAIAAIVFAVDSPRKSVTWLVVANAAGYCGLAATSFNVS